jgi:hypothetical protein
MINEENGEILHCHLEMKGACSDLQILRESGLKIGKKVRLKADLGYYGVHKIHENTQIPFKKPKNGELTKKQKKWNKKFRRKRVKVEHIIRKCKIFRIVKERFRNKGRNLQKIWTIICGIVNLKS